MPLPVKIRRTRVSGPPGTVPLWAETGTAEGCMAPPAVSSEAAAAASSAGGLGLGCLRVAVFLRVFVSHVFGLVLFSHGRLLRRRRWKSVRACAGAAV